MPASGQGGDSATAPCHSPAGDYLNTVFSPRTHPKKHEDISAMRIDLSGKRAIVTGSTAGIGYAIAAGLARSGAAVVVNGRGQAKVKEAVERLKKAVPDAMAEGVAADLGTASGVEAFLAEAGDADILINNMGIFDPKPFGEIPDADWMRFFEVNVMSGVRLSRHYLPKMLAKDWGRIVFISSESAINIPVEMIHYGMTKTAELAISRGLAQMTAGSGVTVNSVLPGPTRSEGVADFLVKMAGKPGVSADEVGKEFIAEHRPTSLLGRLATVEEVANMVVYIASKEASATNGAALRVDGGVVNTII
jgi:NAD(P)-dependent dehydrogenase (short-subunit alcohol dehydrogenase family)